MFWGLISPGQLGLGFFGGGEMLPGAPWSILLDCKFGGGSKGSAGGEQKVLWYLGEEGDSEPLEGLGVVPASVVSAPHSRSGNSLRTADPPGGAGEGHGWGLAEGWGSWAGCVCLGCARVPAAARG